MSDFYVPYAGEVPAALNINGHRLLILAREEDVLEDNLNLVGADHLETVSSGDTQEDEESTLNKLARSINCGVVVAPPDVMVSDIIKNLEQQLPWVQ